MNVSIYNMCKTSLFVGWFFVVVGLSLHFGQRSIDLAQDIGIHP